ncbi:MAG: hypothetical protein DMF62_17945, partial [Acidobacteria bacterium]
MNVERGELRIFYFALIGGWAAGLCSVGGLGLGFGLGLGPGVIFHAGDAAAFGGFELFFEVFEDGVQGEADGRTGPVVGFFVFGVLVVVEVGTEGQEDAGVHGKGVGVFFVAPVDVQGEPPAEWIRHAEPTEGVAGAADVALGFVQTLAFPELFGFGDEVLVEFRWGLGCGRKGSPTVFYGSLLVPGDEVRIFRARSHPSLLPRGGGESTRLGGGEFVAGEVEAALLDVDVFFAGLDFFVFEFHAEEVFEFVV